jgi:hypothetical protein
MESKQAKELASRLVAGERLTQEEELELLAWLQQHPEDRDAYLVDEAVDGLLGCLARLRSTEDSFVAATLRRVVALPEHAGGENEDGSVADNARALPAADHVTTAARLSFERGQRLGRHTNWQTIGVLCASLLLAVGLGGFLLLRDKQTLEANRPAVKSGQENPSVLQFAFARLDRTDRAKWDRPRVAGDRLGAGTLKLVQGAAWIRFDKGTIARVTGPAVIDLRSPDGMLLHRGHLTAQVPPLATGFTVTTPVGRVVDLGTEFDVSVDDAGTTETRVRLGKVSFRPQRQGELPGKPIELTAGGLDRAVSAVPDIAAPVLPVWTQVSGSQGVFVGTICANGKTMEFTSREAFEESRTLVVKQLREAPNEFSEHWSMMVQTSAWGSANASASVGGSSSAGSRRHVSVRENGKTISISQDHSGITVATVEMDGGKEEKTVVKAANAQELERKNPEAYRLYKQHLDGAADAAGPGQSSLPWPSDARGMLREQLRQQLRDSGDNPQMQGLLEKMLRQLDEDE